MNATRERRRREEERSTTVSRHKFPFSFVLLSSLSAGCTACAVSSAQLCFKREPIRRQLDPERSHSCKEAPARLKENVSPKEYEPEGRIFIYILVIVLMRLVNRTKTDTRNCLGVVSFQLHRIRINRGTCLAIRARNNRGKAIRRVARLAYDSLVKLYPPWHSTVSSWRVQNAVPCVSFL